MAKQIPLMSLLRAIDNKDRDFYDSLDDEEKKSFSGYIAMRWSSSISSNQPELDEYYLRSTNFNANKHIFNLSKHPKLQWLMVTAISPGMGTYNHKFVKHKPKVKNTKNKIKQQLASIYPEMKDDDLDTLAAITVQKDITAFNKSCGDGK